VSVRGRKSIQSSVVRDEKLAFANSEMMWWWSWRRWDERWACDDDRSKTMTIRCWSRVQLPTSASASELSPSPQFPVLLAYGSRLPAPGFRLRLRLPTRQPTRWSSESSVPKRISYFYSSFVREAPKPLVVVRPLPGKLLQMLHSLALWCGGSGQRCLLWSDLTSWLYPVVWLPLKRNEYRIPLSLPQHLNTFFAIYNMILLYMKTKRKKSITNQTKNNTKT